MHPKAAASEPSGAFARIRREIAGAGAVEFAIVAPCLLLLLFGVFEGGILLGITHSLAQLSADAGRYAVVGIGADERRALAERWLAREAGHYPLIRPANTVAETVEADGALTVRVAYDASYLPQIPLVGAVVRFPVRIERSATLAIPM